MAEQIHNFHWDEMDKAQVVEVATVYADWEPRMYDGIMEARDMARACIDALSSVEGVATGYQQTQVRAALSLAREFLANSVELSTTRP